MFMNRCLPLLFGLFLCHISLAQNACPTLSSGFGSITTTSDRAVSLSFNLNDYFSDADGDALVFSVSSSNGDALSFSLSGASLSVNTTGNPGNGSLTISASDGDSNCSVSGSLTFDIVAPPTPPPTTTGTTTVDLTPPTLDVSSTIDLTPPTLDVSSTIDLTPPTLDVSSTIDLTPPTLDVSSTIDLTPPPTLDVSGTTDIEQPLTGDVSLVIELPPSPSLDVTSTLQPPFDCPINTNPLPSIYAAYEQEEVFEIDLKSFFSSTEGDEIQFESFSTNPDVAKASLLRGNVLQITSTGIEGDAFIDVIVSNKSGCYNTYFLSVIIEGKTLEQTATVVNQTALDIATCPILTGGLEPLVTSPESIIKETFDLKFFFSDPNNETLIYRLNIENPDVVSAAIEGNQLTITTGTQEGRTIVEVFASNSNGCEAALGIGVLVSSENADLLDLEIPFGQSLENNECPKTISSFGSISVPQGENQTFTYDLKEYFQDSEGDEFGFDVYNTNPEMATVRLNGDLLTVELGKEYGLGFVILNTVGGGPGCIVSAEIPYEVIPDISLELNCQPLLTGLPEISLSLDAPEARITIDEYLNQQIQANYKLSLLGTENDYISAELFGSELVVSVKEIGAGSSAVFIEINDENSNCIEILSLYIDIDDPLGLQNTECPILKAEFPFLVSLQKGESISFEYGSYFANIDGESIELMGALAINDLVESRIEGGVLTLEAKDQVGMTPAAIGVKDEFGLCEIYIPFEVQVLGEGVTSNSCPELIGDIPPISLDETTSEVSINLNEFFQDPDGDKLSYSAYLFSNVNVDFNLIENELTVFSKQNIPDLVILEVSASDPFGFCFVTNFIEIRLSNSDIIDINDNRCPELTGSLSPIVFDELSPILQTFSVVDLFTDPEGDVLNFEVFSSNTGLANAEIKDGKLTVYANPDLSGTTDLIISVNDGNPFCYSNYTLGVVIQEKSQEAENNCPVLVGGIPPVEVLQGASDKIIDISSLVEDDFPEAIGFSVLSSNNNIVLASIEGNYLIFNFTQNNTGSAVVTLKVTDSKADDCDLFIEIPVQVFQETQNLPPYFDPVNISVDENDSDAVNQYDKFLGKINVTDPEGSAVNLSLTGGNSEGLFELRGDQLYRVGVLDYENKASHQLVFTASDGNVSSSYNAIIKVNDISNAKVEKGFSVEIYDTNESTGKSEAYKRYLNPVFKTTTKGVGKWKVRKRISGGADANKFTIKSGEKNKNSEAGEDYLDFITPPDFENPQDANRDNVYEVDVEIINMQDGESRIPVIVSQNSLVAPENDSKVLQIESIPATVLQDTDGDGIQDLIDNSPLQFNPGQEDSDGDGIGDVSDDADQDGVWDPYDICPDTPYGTRVNLEGCPIFTLPASNFTLLKREKCIGENEITLTVDDTNYTYNVQLSGASDITRQLTGDSTTFSQLGGGAYQLCVTVEGVDQTVFERCFDIDIQDPQPLTVYSRSSTNKQQISYDLTGGNVYNVTHNGYTKQIQSNTVDIKLKKGLNTIVIDTGLDCQGAFSKQYFNSSEVVLAPNPAKEESYLYVGGDDPQVQITVFTTLGSILYKAKVRLEQNRKVLLPTREWPSGSYYLKVEGATTLKNLQLMKE